MKHSRRRILRLAASAVALPAIARGAFAQSYPTRQLRWIVGFAAGGGGDIISRIMAAWLAERLGQPVIVENRPGAGSNVSVQQIANSPPDGYSLLWLASSAAINASLYDSLPFNLVRDIAPIAGLVDFPLVMVANPSVPAKTIPELIALAKAEPGKITLASYGVGSTSHVAGELFKMMTGTNMIHVPYRGGAPMITDLIGGQVQVGIDVSTTSRPPVQSGALRALGLCGPRSGMFPDVASIGESVPGYDASAWAGVGAARGTPPEIIERLNRELNAGLANPAVKARLADVATTPLVFTAKEFDAYVTAEVEKWGKVIKLAGIKPA
jgi:tripartite-type tricarboxylate transporter receptor subunit TctC